MWRDQVARLGDLLPEVMVAEARLTRIDHPRSLVITAGDLGSRPAVIPISAPEARLRSTNPDMPLAPVPLPFDPAARALRLHATKILDRLEDQLADHPILQVDTRGQITRPSIIDRLTHSRKIRTHRSPGRLIDTARRLADTLETAVDRPAPAVFAGPCPTPAITLTRGPGDTLTPVINTVCGELLLATRDHETVTCPACHARHQVDHLRAFMLDSIRDVIARPTVIAAAVTSLDRPLTAERLRQWIKRDGARAARYGQPIACDVTTRRDLHVINGRLEPTPPLVLPIATDIASRRPMYRLGDVLDRLDATTPATPRPARSRTRTIRRRAARHADTAPTNTGPDRRASRVKDATCAMVSRENAADRPCPKPDTIADREAS